MATHGFDLVKSFDLDFSPHVAVSKYRSPRTGLSVVHLDYESPIVNGYFVVGTEIFDDSGCPHTLEHLVFMGSKKYPYKGIIDHLANRAFSNGTNAWTDTDHTAYTVSTAGEQGFLQILPIYFHHIDPKGEDSGVVYSEMQGRENTSGDLMALRAQRLLDPVGSAYRSETGGLMEALRVLDVEKIRQYHASSYVPHNLCLVVCGKLSSGTSSVLRVLEEQVEPGLVQRGFDKGPRPPGWKRPFLETPSVARSIPKETIEDTVEFPEQDESVGEVTINFLGPRPDDFLVRQALDVLGTYMTSSSAAPLNKEYIEIDAPLCTYIYFSEDTRATMVNLPIYVGSIPTEHIDTFPARLKASLERIASDGLDMTRMAMVISREERQLRSKLESSKGDTFSGTVISDFLYGDENGGNLKNSMDEFTQYTILKGWTSDQWVAVLRQYYIDRPSVIVKGKPSASLAKALETTEKERVAAQVKKLGPQGLEAATKLLEEAKKEHDTPIPPQIITSFPVPDVKSISWIPVLTVQEPGEGRSATLAGTPTHGTLKRHISEDGDSLSFFTQYDHVESDFVTVHALFSLASLPARLRPHLSVYLSTFFALPVHRSSGAKLTHEEVVNALDDETVSYEAGFGFGGNFEETIRISIKVEVARYDDAVAWLKDVVYGAQFDKERLQITIAKVQQALPELKRDGSTVLSSLRGSVLYDETSSVDFIPALAKSIQENPDFKIRKLVTAPDGVRFSVTGNVLSVKEPRSTLNKYFKTPSPLAPLKLASDTLSAIGKEPAKQAIVLSLPTIESAFSRLIAKGIQGWDHPEYPAFRSYLWRYIRGSGLAYGAHISLDVESGLLGFNLYRSSNSIEATKQGAAVVRGLVDGSIELDDATLDAAKSTIVFSVTKNVSTSGRAAVVSFSNQALRGVPSMHQINLLEKYQAITKEDVIAILKKYFLALFDSNSSVALVVTAPARAEEIGAYLNESGFTVEQKKIEIDQSELSETGDDSAEGSEDESEKE
ncbi:Metalloenzyme, LuxS/M16 peptidase-like protein [Flagelloscypha sp. PMI_526]|nr:Metalloenzyme, LuxS/M16 peptidase-like protein [Flagelloscypha sp. PMI_526]